MTQAQTLTLTRFLTVLTEQLEWEFEEFDVETFTFDAMLTFENGDNEDIFRTEAFKDFKTITRLERDGTLKVWVEL